MFFFTQRNIKSTTNCFSTCHFDFSRVSVIRLVSKYGHVSVKSDGCNSKKFLRSSFKVKTIARSIRSGPCLGGSLLHFSASECRAFFGRVRCFLFFDFVSGAALFTAQLFSALQTVCTFSKSVTRTN